MPPVLLAAGPDRDWLKLDYDGVDRVSARFVPARRTPRASAHDGVVDEVTAWAGGFVVRRESCATLLLRRKLRMRFGVRCTGA